MKTALAVSIALLAAAAHAQGNAASSRDVLVVAPGAKLWLEGNSTLHTYQAHAVTFQTRVGIAPDALPGSDAPALLKSNKVTSVEVTLPVAALRSGEEALDKNLRKALKSEKFPEIRFRMESYRVMPGVGPASIVLEAQGRLTLAGVEKLITLHAVAVPTPTEVHITGQTGMLMTDYGVEPPVLMLGALKTDNKVTVKFELELRTQKPENTAGR